MLAACYTQGMKNIEKVQGAPASADSSENQELSQKAISNYFRGLAEKSHVSIAKKYGSTEHARKMAVARWSKAERDADKPVVKLI